MVKTQTKPQDEANILKKTKADIGFSFPLVSVAPRKSGSMGVLRNSLAASKLHSCNFMIPTLLFYEVNDPLLQVCYKP